MADEEKVLRCSFCNKSQRDVKKLIAGPTVYICDECVDVCNDILADGGIPAGRGTKAAARAIRHAEDYLRMARDLAASENYLGAARELRNAGLEVLRGLALLEDADATRWPETKVVLNALESNSEIARLLHGEDQAHVLLRVSVEGAVFTAAEIQRASEVAEAMTGILREKVAEGDAGRGAPP